MTDNFENKVAVDGPKRGRAWLVHVFPGPGFAGRPAGTLAVREVALAFAGGRKRTRIFRLQWRRPPGSMPPRKILGTRHEAWNCSRRDVRPFGAAEVAARHLSRHGFGLRPPAGLCGLGFCPFLDAMKSRQQATAERPPAKRRGPKPSISDEALLVAIEADLEASPWEGEGHRKVWARLRVCRGSPASGCPGAALTRRGEIPIITRGDGVRV